MGKVIGELQDLKASGDRVSYDGMMEDLLQQLRTEYRKSE